MNNEEMHLLTSIHHGIFPKREKGFEKRGFSYFNNAKAKSEYDNVTQPILSKTKEVLDSFGITNYDLSTWFVEFQQRNCGFEKKAKRTFKWHKDDYSAMGCKVHTVMRKDKSIKGGNLEYKLEKQTYNQKNRNW